MGHCRQLPQSIAQTLKTRDRRSRDRSHPRALAQSICNAYCPLDERQNDSTWTMTTLPRRHHVKFHGYIQRLRTSVFFREESKNAHNPCRRQHSAVSQLYYACHSTVDVIIRGGYSCVSAINGKGVLSCPVPLDYERPTAKIASLLFLDPPSYSSAFLLYCFLFVVISSSLFIYFTKTVQNEEAHGGDGECHLSNSAAGTHRNVPRSKRSRMGVAIATAPQRSLKFPRTL